ncbi:hypothetical protein BDN71DRAFT_1438302 [Pleurotus eryngii]|uniref:Uncharacterized protein n=1 Tax=Pleurotus eryngii TaxID=5323 RepID=A0A9P6ABH9_PLEER|nr:hypothetical protein BDN71DRAFT_1438302 [Pleurotus eryngii]
MSSEAGPSRINPSSFTGIPRGTSGASGQSQQPNLPYPLNWTNPNPPTGVPIPYNPYSQYYGKPTLPPLDPSTLPKTQRSPSPSPSPSSEVVHRHWDTAIRSFLERMGLQQALRGFEVDMLVLNSEWERENAPKIVDTLVSDLTRMKDAEQEDPPTPLDDRKLAHILMENPRAPSSTIKEISRFLSKNRSKNEASNREEFLNAPRTTSCARADAKPQDRDLQMKYDIAKNEDGPLRRTMKDFHTEAQQANVAPSATKDAQLHPGLDDRLKTVETHLAIRYVPSIPRDFLTRLKFLEDHIIRLEKDYPPWSALHFNQPNRGWPPPPRSNPIIVPPHLRAPTSVAKPAASDASNAPPRGEKSSLHQAVMERLEVQQAMGELSTPSNAT